MAFQWGSGGRRLTPEDIEAQRRIASSLTQPDYSPVVSPWQGLARVAGNVTGALQSRSLDKAASANAAETDAVLAALMAPEAKPEAFATAALNRNLDPMARKFAMSRFEAMSKPPEPPKEYEIDAVIRNAGIQPGTPEYAAAYQKYLQAKTDPFQVMNLPGGAAYVGQRSGVGAAMAGGGLPPQQPPQIPTAPVGKLTPIDGGGSVAQAPATFPGPLQGTRRGY